MTAKGLEIGVTFARVGYVGLFIDKINKGSGSWVNVVDSFSMPLPGDLNLTSQTVDGVLQYPLVLPGKDETYRLTLYGRARREDTGSASVYSTPQTFMGFDPPAQKPITNSINLQFSQGDLIISAKTDEKVTLKAAWQVGGSDQPYGLIASENSPNPSIKLSYGALPPSANGSFPAMDIGLFDEHDVRIQEAKIAVSVTTDKSTKAKISKPTSNTKFSWSELAKTGLGAVMQYFTAGI